jgi:hypothetical protein
VQLGWLGLLCELQQAKNHGRKKSDHKVKIMGGKKNSQIIKAKSMREKKSDHKSEQVRS